MDEAIPCDVCGTMFLRNSGSHKYCSVGCFNAVRDQKQSERSLRNRYMLSVAEFRAKYDEQEGGCAICSVKFRTRAEIHVDHDHRCCPAGKSCGTCVRGLLCRNCNTMIGFANDNIEVLQKAVAYLS